MSDDVTIADLAKETRAFVAGKRAALLECAEIAEREAERVGFSSNTRDYLEAVERLAARYRQMAEESGG